MSNTGTFSGGNSTSETGNASGTAGRSAANDVGGVFKEGYHATESLRSNINNFFDNTLQPSAARDSELGVTSRHKQPIDPAAPGAQGHGPAPGKAMGTGSGASSTGTGSTGMSGDAKNLGQSIKESLGGNK